MRVLGMMLLVVGIVMMLVRGFTVPVKKKVVDAGPVQINRTGSKYMGWPTYAGGVLAVLGVILVVADRRRK